MYRIAIIFIIYFVCPFSNTAWAQESYFLLNTNSDSFSYRLDFANEPPVLSKFSFPNKDIESHYIDKNGKQRFTIVNGHFFNLKNKTNYFNISQDSLFKNQSGYSGLAILPSKDSTIFYYLNAYYRAGNFSWICCSRIIWDSNKDSFFMDTSMNNSLLLSGRFKSSLPCVIPKKNEVGKYWIVTYSSDTIYESLFENGKLIDYKFQLTNNGKIKQSISFGHNPFNKYIKACVVSNAEKLYLRMEFNDSLGQFATSDTIFQSAGNFLGFDSEREIQKLILSPDAAKAFFILDSLPNDSNIMMYGAVLVYNFKLKKTIKIFNGFYSKLNVPVSLIYHPNGSILFEHIWTNNVKYSVILIPNDSAPEFRFNWHQSVMIDSSALIYSNVLMNGYWRNMDPVLRSPVCFKFQGFCDSAFFINLCDTVIYKKFRWYFYFNNRIDSSDQFQLGLRFPVFSKSAFVVLKAYTSSEYYVQFGDSVNLRKKIFGQLKVNPNIICKDQIVTFEYSVKSIVNESKRIRLNFDFGDNQFFDSSLSFIDSFVFSDKHIYSKSGNYYSRVITNDGICPDTVFFSFRVEPGFSSRSFYKTDNCLPGIVEINCIDSGTIRIDWGDGKTDSVLSPVIFSHTFVSSGPYASYFARFHPNGCIDTQLTVFRFFDKPSSRNVIDSNFCPGQIIQFDYSKMNYAVKWFDNDSSKVRNFIDTGMYKLSFSNELCIAEQNIYLKWYDSNICSNVPSIFPNPVHDKLMIAFYSFRVNSVQINIYDLTGKEVLKYETESIIGQNSIEILLPDLSEGIYLMKALFDQKLYNSKIVKF